MTKYAIVADTCCETTQELTKKYGITYASFKIDIDSFTFVDDENLDIDNFIDTMNASPNPIKTSCPSPGEYKLALDKNKDADEIFIITISKQLSGSYESASVAKKMFLEENPTKKIHVINSNSAVAGETNVYIELTELLDQNLEFEKIVNKIEFFVENQRTLFVLEDLSNLIKNGRIGKSAGMIANVLSIKPVMRDDGNGEIELHEIVRGINKSLLKIVKVIGEFLEDTSGKRIIISHVRAPEKVGKIIEDLKTLYDFARIEILPAGGLSSGYAADKGIVIAFEQ